MLGDYQQKGSLLKMKILERGNGWHLTVRCTGNGNGNGGCNSLLEISKEDIYVTSSSDYLGDVDYYYTITCPVCGIETDLKQNELPISVKENARLSYKKRA